MKKRLDLTEAKGDFANQINLIISMPQFTVAFL